MNVIGKVSEYYKNFVGRLKTTEEIEKFQTSASNIVVLEYGVLVYSNKFGTYGIRDRHNQEFYLTNLSEFNLQPKDRSRVQFKIEILNGIENIRRWGKTAKLLELKYL